MVGSRRRGAIQGGDRVGASMVLEYGARWDAEKVRRRNEKGNLKDKYKYKHKQHKKITWFGASCSYVHGCMDQIFTMKNKYRKLLYKRTLPGCKPQPN